MPTTRFYFLNALKSINPLDQILENFNCYARLKMNYQKTKRLCISVPLVNQKEMKTTSNLDLYYSSFKYLGNPASCNMTFITQKASHCEKGVRLELFSHLLSAAVPFLLFFFYPTAC